MNWMFILLLILIIMFYVSVRNIMSFPAMIIAGLFTFTMTYIGGYGFYFMLVLLLLCDQFFIKVTDREYSPYDAKQIIANLLSAYVGVICYQAFDSDIFLMVASVCLGASLADTLGSRIGICAKRHFNILHFKSDENPVGGNVSIIGLLASFLGGLIMSVVYFYNYDISYSTMFIMALLGLLGSIIDTIIGGLFEAKYQCSKCKLIVDDLKHCGRKTKLVNGFTWVDNNLVNLSFGIIIFIVSFVVLYLML